MTHSDRTGLGPFDRLWTAYWPGRASGDALSVAARRLLAAFGLLAGTSGTAVTFVNSKGFTEWDWSIALGQGVAMFCVVAPLLIARFRDVRIGAALLGSICVAAVCVMVLSTPGVFGATSVVLVLLVFTFTLCLGSAAGAAGAVIATAMMGVDAWRSGFGADDVYAAQVLAIACWFIYGGAAVYRAHVQWASEALLASQRASEAANVELEARVALRTRELETAKRAAEAANAAKSQFLAAMSHELRTPLNAIIGYTELMREAAEADRRVSDMDDHDRVWRAANLLLAHVNDVLDLSRIESGKLELAPEAFDLGRVIEEAVDTVRTQAHAKGIRLVCGATGLGVIVGGRRQTQQCLVNLLSNAVKFTHEGEVAISGRRDGEQLVIEIADTGIGIPTNKLQAIFEPFVQADNSTTRHYGGTGLGLALTQRLARLLGGDVTVESEVGRGSRFTLTLRDMTADVEQLVA